MVFVNLLQVEQSSVVLEIFKQSSNLSSLSIEIETLVSLVDDDQRRREQGGIGEVPPPSAFDDNFLPFEEKRRVKFSEIRRKFSLRFFEIRRKDQIEIIEDFRLIYG